MAWRALLVLAVVFALLLTTGWTTVRQGDAPPGPYAAAEREWHADARDQQVRDRLAGRALPATDAGPREVARFFDTLGVGQRQWLAERHPLIVGNLDGAPTSLRYRANRTALSQARDVERRRMADHRLTDEGREAANRRAHRFSSLLEPGRQIIAFDPTGRGRAAEVFGDLDRARRVSVIVPGVDTDVLTFQKSARAYSAPVGMARALHAAQRSSAPDLPTATIAWADYTAPSGLGVEAASGELAEEGAERLDDFVTGLPGRDTSPVALFCHSYGSTVCGEAAAGLPSRVSDIVVSGSPGMRADNVDGLRTEARVWSTRDGDDWIADVPHLNVGGLGHGADPVSPGFGARRLSAEGAVGHTGYFVPGTRSLANFTAIAVGTPAAVECVRAERGCGGGDDVRA
ncbi:hypothetical protein E0L36_03505 [Streptomyces sp. AJS327]|uniref:alpha/beta hydrolase n=1 Tax=Streptomyces sp. AJS327 TaxID=2545265 RepID=UPI0015DE9D84|nr:alpha/beta hydrolase [Streptomyces sp. AJS327]MBA0049997.1 hypothetical protein [Streptomyces sp. AJS327]